MTDTALVFVRARTKGGSDLTTIISNMARNNLYTGLPERHQVFDTTDSAQKKVKNYYAGMGFEVGKKYARNMQIVHVEVFFNSG